MTPETVLWAIICALYLALIAWLAIYIRDERRRREREAAKRRHPAGKQRLPQPEARKRKP